MHDNSVSPSSWYIGSYLIRFIEIGTVGNNDPEQRFHSWENTVIVRATSIGEAYDKIERLAQAETEPYEGGPNATPVKWEFVGITEVLPIYEDLEDGAEVMWAEHMPRKLKNLNKMVLSRAEATQRAPNKAKQEGTP